MREKTKLNNILKKKKLI